MEKTATIVGQTPQSPISALLLCGACGKDTVVLYSDFPGLCDVCAQVAHAVTQEGRLEFNRLHGYLEGMAEDLATLAHLLEEAGMVEAAMSARQAADALWTTHGQTLDALVDEGGGLI